MTNLTRREEDVLLHLVQGRTNKQIARELSISAHTVRDYISSMMGKLAVSNRVDLAVAGARIDMQRDIAAAPES